MIAINLNQNISCEYVCYKIQNLIERHNRIDNKEYILVINIKEISSDNSSIIPKIEYKPDVCST